MAATWQQSDHTNLRSMSPGPECRHSDEGEGRVSGVPIVCGIHKCDPAECFDIHYPKAHRVVQEEAYRISEVAETATDEAIRTLQQHGVIRTPMPPAMRGFVKMIVMASAPIIEEAVTEAIQKMILAEGPTILSEVLRQEKGDDNAVS